MEDILRGEITVTLAAVILTIVAIMTATIIITIVPIITMVTTMIIMGMNIINPLIIGRSIPVEASLAANS